MKKIIFLVFFVFLSISQASSNDYKSISIFQDATNKHFGDIDEKIEEYLSNLNDSKNHCFWKDRKQNFVECVNDIERIFDDYSSQYRDSCSKILSDTIASSEKNYIPSSQAGKFINTKWLNLCFRMYDLKISIYKSSAYDILKDNKLQILKDENKLFTQEQRDKYSTVLDLVRINIGYIERLWKKWPSKTKK